MKICFVNTYLAGRDADCEKGLYPRSHLWGIDALRRAGHEVVIAPGTGIFGAAFAAVVLSSSRPACTK